MRKLLFTVLLNLLGLHNALAAETYTLPTMKDMTGNSQVLFISKELKLTPTRIAEENTNLKFNINIYFPKLSGTALTRQENYFNTLVNQLIQQEIRDFKKTIANNFPTTKSLPIEIQQSNLTIDYDVDLLKPADKLIVTIRFNISGMQAGMAHPYHYHKVLNFDLRTGKNLSLRDIFNTKTDYLNVLSKYAFKQLNNSLKNEFIFKEGVAPNPKNYQVWNLESDGILFTFSEYQVASYAAGPQEVHIPYADIKKVILQQAPVMPCVEDAAGCDMSRATA